MDTGFGLALALAFAFALTNGFHDASNAIATLVATRAATPLQAVVLAAVFNVLGPLVVGAAVADTIGGIVTLAPTEAIQVIGAGLAAAVPGTSSRGGAGCRRAPGTRWSAASSAPGCSRAASTPSAGAAWTAGIRSASSARSSRSPSRRCSAPSRRWPRPRAALDRAPRDAALERPGAGRAVGDGGGPRLQPRRQRRAEGGRRRGRAAARRRPDRELAPPTWVELAGALR